MLRAPVNHVVLDRHGGRVVAQHDPVTAVRETVTPDGARPARGLDVGPAVVAQMIELDRPTARCGGGVYAVLVGSGIAVAGDRVPGDECARAAELDPVATAG